MRSDGSIWVGFAGLVSVLTITFSLGCVHAPLNQPLVQHEYVGGVRYVPRPPSSPPDDLNIWLFFSGGGTRAAALSYGVLRELAHTPVPDSEPRRRMIDEVDVISAVSGGSFTAAYYCLYHERIFKDFEARFLKHNVQGELIRRLLTPTIWPRLISPFYGRSDMAADYYNQHLFDGATFGDLLKSGGRPFLILNATDIAIGAQFPFSQPQFDLISSDISSFPISRAVAASSAFPLLLTPITLRNYSGASDADKPDYIKSAVSRTTSGHTESEVRRAALSYLSKDRPFIHLVDGGLSDDLGLQSIENVTTLFGGLRQTMASVRMTPKKLVMIIVNAAAHRGAEWNNRESIPGITSAYAQMLDDLGDRMNYGSLEQLRQVLEEWRQEENTGPRLAQNPPTANSLPPSWDHDFYLININFAGLRQPSEQHFFENLPTNFHLSGTTVDRLVEVGAKLLRDSPDYQRLLNDLSLKARD